MYFNLELNNVRQRQNNVVNMTILKKTSIQKQNNIFELQRICWTHNLLHFFPILRGIFKRIFGEPQKFLKHRIYGIFKTSNILIKHI